MSTMVSQDNFSQKVKKKILALLQVLFLNRIIKINLSSFGESGFMRMPQRLWSSYSKNGCLSMETHESGCLNWFPVYVKVLKK